MFTINLNVSTIAHAHTKRAKYTQFTIDGEEYTNNERATGKEHTTWYGSLIRSKWDARPE